MLKVAYILDTFPVLTETFILREILALQEAGVDVTLFVLRRPPAGPVHAAAAELAKTAVYLPRIGSVRLLAGQFKCQCRHPIRRSRLVGRVLRRLFPHLRQGGRRLWQLAAASWFALEAEKRGIRHLHAHFAYAPAGVARFMAELLDLPFSVSCHAHDIYTQTAAELREKLHHAAFITACTDHGCRHLRQALPEAAAQIHLVRHGLTLADFPVSEPAAGSLILAVGRLEAKKGFRDLIEACRVLRDRNIEFHCRIIGEGRERSNLETQIKAVELSALVSLPGALTGTAMFPHFQEAAIFALPSVELPDGDRDGLPNALLEAMAMQLPVISTTACAAPEIIRAGENGLLVPTAAPVALADALQELLANADHRRTLGTQARQTVALEFDPTRNLQPLRKLLENTAAQHR